MRPCAAIVPPMPLPSPRRAAPALAVLVLAAVASRDARADDDGVAATALVQQLERDSAHSSIAASAIANVKEALERAVRLRAVADEPHAKTADGLAREWAEMARDLARAADAEKTAWDVKRKAEDAQARLERSRVLVEEGIARVGRMRSELDEAARSTPDRKAVESHGSDRPGRKNSEGKDKPTKSAAAGATP
jgi:hypothetical protein